MNIPGPYLLFLGDVTEKGHAKTAYGLAQWCPERCVGQWRGEDYAHNPVTLVDVGLPDMTIQKAVDAGAQSLVIGVAPSGGIIQPHWIAVFKQAIRAGLSIVSGLHDKLHDHEELVALTNAQPGVELIDVRVPSKNIPVASGKRRKGMRLLTVGTDCAVGKKYAALALTAEMKKQGIDCDFRATGQTGIMIAGGGVPLDAVVSDFISGAAEQLSPANDDDHWDVIEGQGSLFHPAYAPVSLGLLQGSQPDAIVVCHDLSRTHLLGWPDYPVADINHCIARNLLLARLTNPDVRCAGICVNSYGLEETERRKIISQIEESTYLPCVDPIKDGVQPIINCIKDWNKPI